MFTFMVIQIVHVDGLDIIILVKDFSIAEY